MRPPPHLWMNKKENVLIDDHRNPSIISEEDKAIHTDFFVPLKLKNAVRLMSKTEEKGQQKRTATQNFSTKPGAVDTVARADKNQQSPNAPWMISFESAAPPTKNWGLSKIWVTLCTSAGGVDIESPVNTNRPYKHLFWSFSKSNSMSLKTFTMRSC